MLTFVPNKSSYWMPNQEAASPYLCSIISQEPGELVFDGYFHVADSDTPFEHIVYSDDGVKKGYYHIRIRRKQTLGDTSPNKQSDDPNEPDYVPGNIKTNVIRLYYDVLAADMSYETALERMSCLT